MASSISQSKNLNEIDARDFDDLLEGIPTESTDQPATTSTSVQTPNTAPRLRSVVVKVEDKKEETEPEFIVKRPWARKAEVDEEFEYFPNRRSKCLESIKNLIEWTRKNVVDFEDGKMFETLLTSEELFNDPGLESHPAADVFLNKAGEGQNAGRKSNSFEFGFRCFARKIFFSVFKDKCHGLVNRNFSKLRGWSKRRQMEGLGKFMDKILETAERVEYIEEDDARYELDRLEVENIKNEFIPFTTANKAGSYEIEIYTKDVSVGEDEWLLLLLKHVSFAWDNVTMMRAKQRAIRSSRLQWYFRSRMADEYFEGIALINELLRNPNVLAPGNWSNIFM